MDQKKFEKIYETIINDLLGDTIPEHISDGYKAAEETEGLAEQEYMQLDLSKKQRKVVDKYIDSIATTDIAYQQSIYRCAVHNTIRALIYFGFLKS